MSGGHWGYLSREFDAVARRVSLEEDCLSVETFDVVKVHAGAALELLGAIEHELDWGFCGDSCFDCAVRHVVPALERFFDEPFGASVAVAVLRDHDNLRLKCDSCLARIARAGLWPEPGASRQIDALIEIAKRRGLTR